MTEFQSRCISACEPLLLVYNGSRFEEISGVYFRSTVPIGEESMMVYIYSDEGGFGLEGGNWHALEKYSYRSESELIEAFVKKLEIHLEAGQVAVRKGIPAGYTDGIGKRRIFMLGMFLYLASFFLETVSITVSPETIRRTPERVVMRGWECVSFFFAHGVKHMPALVIYGIWNLIFIIGFILLRAKIWPPFADTLRLAVFVGIFSCWVIFYRADATPLVGYYLWGMSVFLLLVTAQVKFYWVYMLKRTWR